MKRNKRKLIETLEFDNTDISPVRKTGKSNTTFILKNLKGITSYSTLTEFDQDRITKLMDLFEDGAIPINISKEIAKTIRKMKNPIEILNVIWDMVPDSYIKNSKSKDNIEEYSTEVVLSLDLV